MMMSHKEQENKILEELPKIKPILEKLIGYKINKKNFKKSLVDFMPFLSNNFDESQEITNDERAAIGEFFTTCNPHLGDVVWAQVKDKTLNIKISYEDNDLTSWHVPIAILLQKEENFKAWVSLLVKGFGDSLFAFFLSPQWRELVLQGDEEAIKLLYSSFNRPSINSCLSNLIMIKDCFPDFYSHITTKLDIMTVESMQEFINNKNVTRQSNQTLQGKKKRVSRVKKI